MKIVFITGSMEPGRDGVGDYVRTLALALTKKGIETGALAFYDSHCKIFSVEYQGEGPDKIEVLRLPHIISEVQRVEIAREWIARKDYTWVSVQFVPFAYNHKGLPFQLGRSLDKLVGGRRCHLMVHEIWVGKSNLFDLKGYLIGSIQKTIIKNMTTRMQPEVIHTNLPYFRYRLKQIGVLATPLPLFSNMPVVACNSEDNDKSLIRVGCFSRITPYEPLIRFIKLFAVIAGAQKKKLEVMLLGAGKMVLEQFAEKIASIKKENITVTIPGFLEPRSLSTLIASCDFGLTAVPRYALGKSGSVAAFLAQGIPVAAPNTASSRDWNGTGFFLEEMEESIFTEPDLDALTQARCCAKSCAKQLHVSLIANTFLEDLGESGYDAYLGLQCRQPTNSIL